MSVEEIRNVLYCHLMDLEANNPYNWDYDIWQVKQALTEVIEFFDREMERYRKGI